MAHVTYKYSIDVNQALVRYLWYVEYSKRAVDENVAAIIEGVLVNRRGEWFDQGSDEIKVVVCFGGEWSVVRALQFHTGFGVILPMYGIKAASSQPTKFQGSENSSSLVGIYGRYGGVIDSLGFPFASVELVLSTTGRSCFSSTVDAIDMDKEQSGDSYVELNNVEFS